MAFADTARLAVQLDLKGNFTGNLRATQKALGDFDRSVSSTGSRAYKAGTQIGTGIKNGAYIAAGAVGFLALNIGKGLQSLTELETVTTQTNAVLKSTKGVAGETAKSIRDLAEKYEGLNATIDDKVIQSAENVLLTFTAIRKQAFEPAIRAALDMSTALGTDLQGSVIQIGKALQDPIKGITALRRVGVNFSADQIKVIKRLVETGHTLEAQKLILKELNTEFGGSFIAQGNTTAGKVAKFKDAIEDLQKALATALLPTIGKVADGLTKFLADPEVVRSIEGLGQKIASLFSNENLAKGADFLKGAFQTAKDAAPVVESAARATFGLVQGAVGLFKSLPPEIQKLAIGAFAVNKLTGGLVTNIAGGIIETVGKQFLQRGGTPANPLFVADVTGGLGKGIAGVAGGLTTAGLASALRVGLTTFVLPALAGLIVAGVVAGVGPFAKSDPKTRGQILPPKLQAEKDKRDAAQLAALNAMRTEAAENRTALRNLPGEFARNLAGIQNAKQEANIVAAVKAAVAQVNAKREKLGDQTSNSAAFLKAMKAQLKNVHDPALAKVMRASIARVEGRLSHLKELKAYAATQVHKADGLLRNGIENKHELKNLQSIERSLRDHGLPRVANRIRDKIEAAKKAQVSASNHTADAIRRKKLQVTTNVTVPVTSYVSVQGVLKKHSVISRYSGNIAT